MELVISFAAFNCFNSKWHWMEQVLDFLIRFLFQFFWKILGLSLEHVFLQFLPQWFKCTEIRMLVWLVFQNKKPFYCTRYAARKAVMLKVISHMVVWQNIDNTKTTQHYQNIYGNRSIYPANIYPNISIMITIIR